MVANENWHCNLSAEINSTMDLVVGPLDGAKIFCNNLAFPRVPLVLCDLKP